MTPGGSSYTQIYTNKIRFREGKLVLVRAGGALGSRRRRPGHRRGQNSAERGESGAGSKHRAVRTNDSCLRVAPSQPSV